MPSPWGRLKQMSKDEFQKVLDRNKAIKEGRQKETEIKCYARESYNRGQANKTSYMSHNAFAYKLDN